ncbi:MAG: ribosome small subunit-dependent GTPase A [Synechococcales cyanobacterium]
MGDWVALRPINASQGVIEAILPRRSQFSRQAAGHSTQEQVVAANIDTVFLVSGLDGDFNVRRLERFLTAAWDSGARPVMVLNKADLCPEVDALIQAVENIAPDVPVLAVSAESGQGLEQLYPYLGAGQTVALLGSSGVGKSTLTNRLVGSPIQRTQAVRLDDSRGRHTTTSRQLIPLPQGGWILDTPGMRELKLWQADTGLLSTFEEISELTHQCRFRDCTHQTEPGCAVQQAVADGRLERGRLENFLKLQRELAYQHRRRDQRAALEEKAKWKKIHKALRQHHR